MGNTGIETLGTTKRHCHVCRGRTEHHQIKWGHECSTIFTKCVHEQEHDEIREKNKAKDLAGPDPLGREDGEYVICPWCGNQEGDASEWVEHHREETECGECGGHFSYYVEHEATYYTEPVRKEEKDEK